MIAVIISIVLNLLLGAPAGDEPTMSTTSADTEEQALETMGGSAGWNNSKDE